MIRVIDAGEITRAVAELCIKANISVSEDIRCALAKARDAETAPLAKSALDTLLRNADVAESEQLPICQDTGMAVVFLQVGQDVHINGNVEQAINEGVRKGYRDGYFRNSVVACPVNRLNTGDNTPAVIHYDLVPGDSLSITVAPKGFGSENMGGIAMLTPSDGLDGVVDYIVGVVKAAGSNPCPPVIVGAGVGGTMEKAALLAKRALLREVGSVNAEPFWAKVEARCLERINALGIGAAGYGGGATALGVHINPYPTHIAGLPVAVNIGCHVTRHETAVL